MSDKFNALKVQKIYNLSFIYLKNMAGNKKTGVSRHRRNMVFNYEKIFSNLKIGFSLIPICIILALPTLCLVQPIFVADSYISFTYCT